MSGIILALLFTLLPSLLVTPLLAMHNVSSSFIVKLIRTLWGISITSLLVVFIFGNQIGIDGYFTLAIVWLIVGAISYWIINKITIAIFSNRDALYGSQLDALGIKWWQFKKWNAVRLYVRNSRMALRSVKEIYEMECSNKDKAEMIDALLPINYYTKAVNAGWVGIIPAINVCENIYEVAVIYDRISERAKAEEWFSTISLRMHDILQGLISQSESVHSPIEDTLTRIVNVWVKCSIQWIICLVHTMCYEEARTVMWVLFEGLYDIQTIWPDMATLYKESLRLIHKELVSSFAFLRGIKDDPMQTIYIRAIDKLHQLDTNNHALEEYRQEAYGTTMMDIIRSDIYNARHENTI